MRRVLWYPCLLLATMACTGCWRATPTPRPLDVERTSPALGGTSEPVLLNDSITVYFTDTIQPLSITTESVNLTDDQGHKVPGTLRVSANWVTFHPDPPLARDLADGSFRPGATYRLHIAGSPRPDAVRATDGRRLAAARVFEVRIADWNHRPPGLVAPLRPPASDLPFWLPRPEVPQILPADAPRLRLHFTLPVLPSSVSPDAFVVRMAPTNQRIRPRSARIVRSRLDEFPGSTVELDLGSLPSLEDGTGTVDLRSVAHLSVELAVNGALTDYAGNAPLPSPEQYWSVVEGSSVALAEWPGPNETSFAADDLVSPGFELRGDVIRPRVRIEAGDGSLGVFRPQRDTVLRPGMPFDRGDGRQVVSVGISFPFLAVDIREGITVVVDASNGPTHVLSCGGIRIDGTIEIVGGSAPWSVHRFGTVAVAELLAGARAVLLAAGDVWVGGVVRTAAPAAGNVSPLLVAMAGQIHLSEPLPFNTLLAYEEGGSRAILGPLGQAIPVPAAFTFGVAAGADFVARGYTSWRQLPMDRDGAIVRLVELEDALQVAWQGAAPDPLRKGVPESPDGGLARPKRVADRDAISVPPGGFVRFQLEARVTAASLPTLHEVRLVDR